MQPKRYMLEVNRYLILPPWHRLQELNHLAREFYAGKADGQSVKEIEERLGSPYEASVAIQSRYPRYQQSLLRYPFLFLACFGAWELFWTFVTLKTHLYDSVVLSARAAAASPSLTPGKFIFLCILAIAVGLFFYSFFKYVPEENPKV